MPELTNPPNHLPRRKRHAPARRSGAFTLLETALATVIVGVGVLALVEAQTAFLRSNGWSTQSATATYLANEIRELTRRLPKHDPISGLYLDTSGGGSTLRGWGPNAGATTVADFNHLDAFDGLRLSFDGDADLTDHDLPGPVDAFGAVIPEIDAAGTIVRDRNGAPVPVNGWSQIITVQKIDPFNSSLAYANNAVLPANTGTGFKGLAVDKFPLRVSVTVTYRGPFDSQEAAIATVSWIVP